MSLLSATGKKTHTELLFYPLLKKIIASVRCVYLIELWEELCVLVCCGADLGPPASSI